MTLSTLRVLKVFVDAFEKNTRVELAGVDIMRRAGMLSGTMYPILLRLEEIGWIRGHWESQTAEKLGRPRRRFYRLTGSGQTAAREVLSEHLSFMLPRPQES
jgi:DNA-binding PadR family transcriptional regulator